jgi:hypothetical protein
VLQAYSNIGELTDERLTITGAELAAQYVPYEKLFKTIVEYPSNEGKHCESMKADILVRRIHECLMTQAAMMIDAPLIPRILPSKALFAKSEIAVGKVRLSPVTGSVYLLNPRKKGVCPYRQQCTLKYPDGSTVVYCLGTPAVDANFCSAFFLVGVTHDKTLANMVLTHEEVSFIPASKKLKISGQEHIVAIPVLVNESIIKPGMELLIFVEKEVTVKPPPDVQGLQMKAVKRAKVASS